MTDSGGVSLWRVGCVGVGCGVAAVRGAAVARTRGAPAWTSLLLLVLPSALGGGRRRRGRTRDWTRLAGVRLM